MNGDEIEPSFVHRPEQDLPEGWSYAALGSLGVWSTGGTPSKSRPEFWSGGALPWLSPKDMKVPYLTDAIDHITNEAVDSGVASVVPPGTVLFVVRGMILAHTFPVGLTTREVAFNQDMRSIVPHGPMHPPYLLWALRAEAAKILAVVREATHGTLRLESDVLQSWPIAIPPLAEQRRIAKKVEALLADVDRAKERLGRVRQLLKRLRLSSLAAACSGKLTREWRTLRPKDVHGAPLKTVRDLRRSAWLEAARLKAQHYHKTFDAAAAASLYTEPEDVDSALEVPEEWTWTRLDDLTLVAGGVTKGQRRRSGAKVRQVPYLRVANVQRGRLDLSEVKTIAATADEIWELSLKPGDVLLNEGGDIDKLGRGWVWSGQIDPCIHQNHVFRARPCSPLISPHFLSHYANTFGQEFFFDSGAQTVNLASISMTKLKALPVPLPSRAEQDEIVSSLERILRTADNMEGRLQQAITACEAMSASILSKASSGGLVPTEAELARNEGRPYEPADQLLERVRAIRKATRDTLRLTLSRQASRRTKAAKGAFSDELHSPRSPVTNRLSTILRERGALKPEALWSASGLSIDAFYDQLKGEEMRGLLRERPSERSTERLLESEK